MNPAVRAAWHAWRTKHKPWSDEYVWPGGGGTVWFCDCGEQFWPKEAMEALGDWRCHTVARERPTK